MKCTASAIICADGGANRYYDLKKFEGEEDISVREPICILSPSLAEIRLINVNVSSISFYFIYFHSFLPPLLVIWIQYVQKSVATMKTAVCPSSMTRTSIRQISPSA
jgi:hypothetical protein